MSIKELESEALVIPEKAKALQIVSNETYVLAGNLLVQIKGLRKRIKGTFKPMKQKLDEAKREILNQERAADAPLVEAENVLKPGMVNWDMKQEQERRKEEARLQEIARKQEEEKRLADAVALEAQGDKTTADQVLATPVDVAPVVVAKTVPKVDGVSFKGIWKFQIIDVLEIPREYLIPDEVKIGLTARTLKSACNIPGIRAYSEKIMTGRTQ